MGPGEDARNALVTLLMVRRGLFIALVVIVLVTGLPVLMGMGHAAGCDFCGPGVLVPLLCLVALAGTAVALPELLRRELRLQQPRLRLAVFGTVFERPPQLV